MPTYFYSAQTEALRRSLEKSTKPSIGIPSNVFVVRTDEGDEVHIPTETLDKFATIVVSTPPCTKKGYSILVSVTNRAKRAGSTRGIVKDALSLGMGEAAGDAAKKYAKPTIDRATALAREKITDKLATRVGGKASMGVSGYLARQAGGLATRQLSGLAASGIARAAVSTATGGPASVLVYAGSATSTGLEAEKYHTRITGKTVSGVGVNFFINGTNP